MAAADARKTDQVDGRSNFLADFVGLAVFALCSSPLFMPLVLLFLGFPRAAIASTLVLFTVAAGFGFYVWRKLKQRHILSASAPRLRADQAV
jgi:hypothetical protein